MALGSAHLEHVAGVARAATELAVKHPQTQGACSAAGSELGVWPWAGVQRGLCQCMQGTEPTWAGEVCLRSEGDGPGGT